MTPSSHSIYLHGARHKTKVDLFFAFARAVKKVVPDIHVIMTMQEIIDATRNGGTLSTWEHFNKFSRVDNCYRTLAERMKIDSNPVFITTDAKIARFIASQEIPVITLGNGLENSLRMQSIAPTADALSRALANITAPEIR